MDIKTRLHALVVLAVKWAVSAVIGFAAARNVDLSWLAGYEAQAAVALSAAANWVLNEAAHQAQKVAWLAPVVAILWPLPNYEANDLNAGD